jgi:hypothetical protein
MFCKRCDKEIPDDSQICPECGESLSETPVASSSHTGSWTPKHDGETAPISPAYAYRELYDLTRFLKYCLLAYLTVSAVSAASDLAQMTLLQDIDKGEYISEAEADSNDTRQEWIGYIFLAVFTISGITFLRWVYAANRNVRALGATGLKFSPGWAVGCYFVPILWLWKPYQAMREIWKCSQDPTDWHTVPNPSLLRWWWFLWLCSVNLAQISMRLGQSDDVESLIFHSGFSASLCLFKIPLSLVAIAMVAKVHEMQWTWADRQGSVQA